MGQWAHSNWFVWALWSSHANQILHKMKDIWSIFVSRWLEETWKGPDFAEATSLQPMHRFTPTQGLIEASPSVGVHCHIYPSVGQVIGFPWAAKWAAHLWMLTLFCGSHISATAAPIQLTQV